jgi:dTDP-4-dehydrorhamnose 3,5-epimerase
MELVETRLGEVKILRPRVFEDGRGFFLESYNQRAFAALGITAQWVQDNHSRSVRNTVRGLHFQVRQPQAKLCRVVCGEILDVAVDIRRGSPTFGQWTSVLLSAENRLQIYVPRGFAHGFAVLSDVAEVLYKCDEFYAPDDEAGIAWDDPSLRIEWGITGEALLSPKDTRHPGLRDIPGDRLPVWEPVDAEA